MPVTACHSTGKSKKKEKKKKKKRKERRRKKGIKVERAKDENEDEKGLPAD